MQSEQEFKQNIITLNCGGEPVSRIVTGSVRDNLPELLGRDKGRVIVITDANAHLHNREFIDSFDHIVIGQGESSKTLIKLVDVYRKLLEMDADRSTFLLGVGGGIVTDITGFVASTYMRGVDFGFVPTTLLGQVDAGIGGKNGVNLDGYKNIIGVFNQPGFVICDPAMLRTLPEREFRAGLAEVIKAGIIGDPELFWLLEWHTFEDICNGGELLSELILRAIKVKVAVVESDEKEAGGRRVLNLGHTFAHAMEKTASLYSHGEAVAAGIALIAVAAVKLGKLPAEDAVRIHAVIEKMGLPVEYPVEIRKLLAVVRHDKKKECESIGIIFPTAIGHCETVKMTLDEMVRLMADAPEI